MRVELLASFMLIAAIVVGVLAWWDVQRRRLSLDEFAQETLRGDVAQMKRELNTLRELDQSGHTALCRDLADFKKSIGGDDGLTENIIKYVAVAERKLREEFAGDVRFADLDQRTKWCEQNIRDLGKTPPKRHAKNHLPSPFGQKT